MSESERESRVGSRIGHYRLMRLLGKGGMGEVYEAEDTVKDRIVALKLLPESVSDDPVFRKRLQREAHSAGRLQEPHVVPIHDYGEIDGLLYVDMRMINGTDLRKMLKRFGPIAPARHLRVDLRAARVPGRVAALSRRQRQRAHHSPPDGAHSAAQRNAPGHS
jgi:serine/threonine protein kinase